MRRAAVCCVTRAFRPVVWRAGGVESSSCELSLRANRCSFSSTYPRHGVLNGAPASPTQSAAVENVNVAALHQFASESLSVSWTSAARFAEELEKHFHSSDPIRFGCSTLLELTQRHNEIFEVKTGKDGQWSVRFRQSKSRDIEDVNLAERVVQKLKTLHASFPEKRVFTASEVFSEQGSEQLRILDQLVSHPDAASDVQMHTSLRIRPKVAQRNAYVFVDGDELPRAAVSAVLDALTLNAEGSEVVVARRSASSRYNAQDRITPDGLPTYTQIEKEATRLRMLSGPVLKDVVYICSGRQFELYESHVARANDFPDADVYVCCPSRIKLVAENSRVPI